VDGSAQREMDVLVRLADEGRIDLRDDPPLFPFVLDEKMYEGL
jgi:hypothetical protein